MLGPVFLLQNHQATICLPMCMQTFRYCQCLGAAEYNGSILKIRAEFWKKKS